MRDSATGRLGLAAVVGIALSAVWPTFAVWWTHLLSSLASSVWGESTASAVMSPTTASPVLAVSAVVLIALALPARTRLLLVLSVIAATLLGDVLVITAIAVAEIPFQTAAVLVGIPEDVVPLAWVIAGVTWASRRRRDHAL